MTKKRYYRPSSFNTCLNQVLPKIDGPPMNIFLKEGAVPHAVHRPSTVPIHYRDKIKKDRQTHHTEMNGM